MATTEIVKLRRQVLVELSKLAYQGNLKENVQDLLTTIVTEKGPRYRCCVHKERAILEERIKLALHQSLDRSLDEAAERAVNGEKDILPNMQVMPIACDECPIDKYFVTNGCRNCVAHNCMNACPKNAITVVEKQAYIDKTKCVECGLCKKACQYNAIIEMTRPCEAACAVNAISTDEDRKSVIDYEKCVECGKCKNACPFGAISDQSSIVQVLSDIKQGKRVYALLAPAFIGQFGVMVKIGQIFNTMKQIGFHDVREVSYAADITTIEESKEFFETVPSERPFMTTSCCPSFTALIEKHMPKMKQYVSSTASPMISMGRAIKSDDPDAVTVFVGPCIAKKREARDFPGAIDHVLTFEEVTCLLVGCGLNVMSAEDAEHDSIGSKTGILFGHAGGVALSVKELAEDLGKGDELRIEQRDGLTNCKAGLLQLNAGKLDANLFEGMACEGGCIAGPGTLSNPKVADKALTTFAEKSKYKIANQNEEVNERLAKGGHWHVDRK